MVQYLKYMSNKIFEWMIEVPLLENGLFINCFVKKDPFGHVSKRP